MLYSDITIDDQYVVFTVGRKGDDPDISFESGFQAGVLKYDFVHETSQYFAYEPYVYLESQSNSENSIYYAYIQWTGLLAEITIHQLDCRSMSTRKVYTLSIEDSAEVSREASGLWALELIGLSDRLLKVGIPTLPYPARGDKSRISHYLLVDLDAQTHAILADETAAEADDVSMPAGSGRIFSNAGTPLGVICGDCSVDLHNVQTGEKLFSTSPERMIRFANDEAVLTQYFAEGHVLLHDIRQQRILAEYTSLSNSFHYLEKQDLMILIP